MNNQGVANLELVNSVQVNGILMILTAGRTAFRQGRTIRFNLIKVNTTNRPITLNYETSQILDFEIIRDQRVLFRLSDEVDFSPQPRTITLQPREARVFFAEWDQRINGNLIRPGFIKVRVFNLADLTQNTPVSLTLEIRERSGQNDDSDTSNLVRNPGFERWQDENTPIAWQSHNVVRSSLARTGNFAALMGEVASQGAKLSQEINNLASGSRYRLSFWLRQHVQVTNVRNFTFNADIILLNRMGNELTRTNLTLSPPQIPTLDYRRFSFLSPVIPSGVDSARIVFRFEPSFDNNSRVLLDDVNFQRV